MNANDLSKYMIYGILNLKPAITENISVILLKNCQIKLSFSYFYWKDIQKKKVFLQNVLLTHGKRII